MSRVAMPIFLAPGAIACMQFAGFSCEDLSVVDGVFAASSPYSVCLPQSVAEGRDQCPDLGIDRFGPTALVGLPHLCPPQRRPFASSQADPCRQGMLVILLRNI